MYVCMIRCKLKMVLIICLVKFVSHLNVQLFIFSFRGWALSPPLIHISFLIKHLISLTKAHYRSNQKPKHFYYDLSKVMYCKCLVFIEVY